MLRNFFKTATRNIFKHRAYSIINFIGLTTGLALSLLIITYVRHEFSYDDFYEKSDRLYRLSYTAPNGLKLATSPPPIAPAMKDFFPEVEEAARVYRRNVSISIPDKTNDESFEETDVLFADSTLMDMMSFEFVKGNARNALHDKFTVIITDEMAVKYFGDKNPIGEALLFLGKHSFKVTGVVKRFPENAHIRFNMLVPYESMYELESDQAAQILRNNLAVNFIISHSYTYVLLKAGANPKSVDQNMEAFLKKNAQPQFLVGQVFTLMPMKDIHLKSELLAEPSAPNSMSNLYIFMGVGVLTLIIACINYINLSTAQSFTRMKEIGIRKILGSLRFQIISQFMAESFLFCLIAMMLSYVVFYTTLPFMNQLLDKQLIFVNVVDKDMVIMSAVLLIVITLLAGGYPSYFVTNFNSVSALKGAGITQHGSQFLRKTLVVFQLAIACMLLSGSLLIMKQLNFINNQSLGFEKEHIINVPLFSQNLNGIFRQNDSTYRVRLQSFRDIIQAQTGVHKTTLSSNAPGLGAVYRGTIPDGFTREDNMFIGNMSVDYDFLETYGMELVAGRTFNKDFGTDGTEAFIINETAVHEFNWESSENALGKTINREGKIGKVVGIIKDFNFSSLTTSVSALILEVNPNQFNTLSVKFDNANVKQTISKIENQWNNLFPEKTFEFTFLDEQLNEQYANYQSFGSIIQTFTFIAILISCLGVYGLVLFVVQCKVKEIGVRKVLGASIGNILHLIYKDFILLLILGFLSGIPVSYYFMNHWLENFSYRTNIDFLTYGTSFFVVFMIVTITISYQALRASMTNPVTSLRSE